MALAKRLREARKGEQRGDSGGKELVVLGNGVCDATITCPGPGCVDPFGGYACIDSYCGGGICCYRPGDLNEPCYDHDCVGEPNQPDFCRVGKCPGPDSQNPTTCHLIAEYACLGARGDMGNRNCVCEVCTNTSGGLPGICHDLITMTECTY